MVINSLASITKFTPESARQNAPVRESGFAGLEATPS
jgi:hypothetical protein